jgi:hypothetical protein
MVGAEVASDSEQTVSRRRRKGLPMQVSALGATACQAAVLLVSSCACTKVVRGLSLAYHLECLSARIVGRC